MPMMPLTGMIASEPITCMTGNGSPHKSSVGRVRDFPEALSSRAESLLSSSARMEACAAGEISHGRK